MQEHTMVFGRENDVGDNCVVCVVRKYDPDLNKFGFIMVGSRVFLSAIQPNKHETP